MDHFDFSHIGNAGDFIRMTSESSDDMLSEESIVLKEHSLSDDISLGIVEIPRIREDFLFGFFVTFLILSAPVLLSYRVVYKHYRTHVRCPSCNQYLMITFGSNSSIDYLVPVIFDAHLPTPDP